MARGPPGLGEIMARDLIRTMNEGQQGQLTQQLCLKSWFASLHDLSLLVEVDPSSNMFGQPGQESMYRLFRQHGVTMPDSLAADVEMDAPNPVDGQCCILLKINMLRAFAVVVTFALRLCQVHLHITFLFLAFQANAEEYHPDIGDGIHARNCRFCGTEELTEEQMIMHMLLNELNPPEEDEEAPPCQQLQPACEQATDQFRRPFKLEPVSDVLQDQAWEVVYDCLNIESPALRSPEVVRTLVIKLLGSLGSRRYEGHINGLDGGGTPIATRREATSRESELSHLAATLYNKDAISSIPVATAVAAALEGIDSNTPIHKVFEEQKAAASGQNRARGFKLPAQYRRIP